MAWTTSEKLIALNFLFLPIFISWIEIYKSVSVVEEDSSLFQFPVREPQPALDMNFNAIEIMLEMWDLSFTVFLTPLVLAGIFLIRS